VAVSSYMVSHLRYLPCLQEEPHVLYFAVSVSGPVTEGCYWMIYAPEKLLRLAARIVMTTLKSPLRSAYSSNRTAARLLTGRRSHSGKGGGLKALRRATAALGLMSFMVFHI
jgi:hypothetical protein